MAVSKSVQDFVDKINEQFAAVSTSVDELVTSQAGVAGDVTKLKGIIDKLQNNPGPISAEDQALLDQAVATATTLATKTSDVSKALKELDATTDPDEVPPPPAG
jgi:hypothetical protein